MRILVTNDDGVNAPGIIALAEALREIADVVIVAPDRNRSGASHSLTLSRPLYVEHLSDDVISVQGTPTDCVHLALTGLLDVVPDIVVSGINAGANLGDDVVYSGTVGAALEGRFLGFPSLAVSLLEDNTDYKTAAIVVRDIVQHLLKCNLRKTTTLNINVPNIPLEKIEGYDITRLGSRHSAEPAIKQRDPRGRDIYWIGAVGAENDSTQGTDFYAVRHNRVSITPLDVDLTNYQSFDEVSHWVEKFQIHKETLSD